MKTFIKNLGATLLTPFAVNLPAAPANDNFNNAIPLSGVAVTATGSNVGASKERLPFPPPGEPSHAGNTGGASVWWTWTAPVSAVSNTVSSGSHRLTAVGKSDSGLS
jgi:hypothetical protein